MAGPEVRQAQKVRSGQGTPFAVRFAITNDRLVSGSCSSSGLERFRLRDGGWLDIPWDAGKARTIRVYQGWRECRSVAEKNPIDRHAEFLDVQLLDVLASVEAVLRDGREIQREALRVRGVPSPVTHRERLTAAGAIRDRIDRMQSECTTLCKVVEDLRISAVEFERLLGTSGGV